KACKQDVLAPVSTFILIASMPKSGNAPHSRQPNVFFTCYNLVIFNYSEAIYHEYHQVPKNNHSSQENYFCGVTKMPPEQAAWVSFNGLANYRIKRLRSSLSTSKSSLSLT